MNPNATLAFDKASLRKAIHEEVAGSNLTAFTCLGNSLVKVPYTWGARFADLINDLEAEGGAKMTSEAGHTPAAAKSGFMVGQLRSCSYMC